MAIINKFTCEHLSSNCYTDKEKPIFHFNFIIDKDEEISSITLKVNDFEETIKEGSFIIYSGSSLTPFTKYTACLKVVSNKETTTKEIEFETCFLNTKWKANWITDKEYVFKEKRISPKVMVFHKNINISKKIKEAKIYSTAIGTYDIYLNNSLISNRYLAPGFTSYKHQLQYQCYDITSKLNKSNSIHVLVAGGWAVGSYVFTRKNRITDKKQSLLLELRIKYEDGSEETIITDPSWDVSMDSPYIEADLYDGESYDANVKFENIKYHKASIKKLKISPSLICDYGSPVRKKELMIPKIIKTENNLTYFDFEQNFAGVINLKIKNAEENQKIIIKHAEILNKDGSLNTEILRSAKQEIVYICKKGEQEYSPRFTYMGFRYVTVEGINKDDYELTANAIYSDVEEIGSFECSSPLINRLHKNILWSAKSNFVDIPTDCPQRDERMGWTGDIAVFAPTAFFLFSMDRFIDKWLIDLKSEQLKTGGIPNTIPSQGYGFPTTMPKMAVDFWGDAVILVPYEKYLQTGDINILKLMYPNMKKYVNACLFWAHLLSVGKRRYIWHTPSLLHFGDWISPDVDKMSAWQKRSIYTATASLKNTSYLLSLIAGILNEEKDAKHYFNVSVKTSDAYNSILAPKGKLKHEFQTGYVLPLHYKMLDEVSTKNALDNLSNLIIKNNYCIKTGFPGTPYILFALSENDREDLALKMLLNTKCPSWLYEVKVGATTIWERWDGLDEDGQLKLNEDGTGGMISYNHYASGAVGDFLHKRIGGIEPIEPGYKKFRIKHLITKEITSCFAKTISPFGKIEVKWSLENNIYKINVEIPCFTECELHLPSGKIINLKTGNYTFEESI